VKSRRRQIDLRLPSQSPYASQNKYNQRAIFSSSVIASRLRAKVDRSPFKQSSDRNPESEVGGGGAEGLGGGEGDRIGSSSSKRSGASETR
jgi:hypothetical protein